MSLSYFLGVDFGGSSSKATLLSSEGKVVATAVTEYPTYYPHDGWAEQDPKDSYRALLSNIKKILDQSGIDAKQIRAITLDGATHTSVLSGRTRRTRAPRHLLDRPPRHARGGVFGGALQRSADGAFLQCSQPSLDASADHVGARTRARKLQTDLARSCL